MFHNMKTEETNKPLDTKTKIINLLQRANDYIWMSTGLNSDFYNDADVKKSMIDAFGRVKNVRLLIEGDAEAKKTNVGWLFEEAKKLKGKLQIRQCDEVMHWIMVDGKHFRLEKNHDFGIIGVNNLFVCDVQPPAIAEILKRKFDEWWFVANPVDT